jgi:hypothetical protein
MIDACLPSAKSSPVAVLAVTCQMPVVSQRTDLSAAFASATPPPLKWVRKTPRGEPLIVIETFSAEDERALRRWYVTPTPEGQLRADGDKCLSKGAQIHARIACACRPDKEEDPPLMTPYELLAGNGAYSLRRLMQRTQHARDCIFYFDRPPLALVDDTDDDIQEAHEPLDLLRGSGRPRPCGDRQPRGARKTCKTSPKNTVTVTAHRAETHILASAGRNKITAGRTQAGEIAAIALASACQVHRKNPALSLCSCMWVQPENPTQADLLAVLFSRSSGMWPPGELANGYVLLVASAIHKRSDGTCGVTVHWVAQWKRTRGGNRFPVRTCASLLFRCEIRIAEPPGECVRAPYLVLLRAAMQADGTPTWIDGSALPIASKDCWVPVASNAERDAVFAQIRVAALLDLEGTEHDMEKNLKVIKSDSGERCSPDFIARRFKPADVPQKLISETQRSNSHKYHNGKKKPHRVMRDLGMLYFDDRQKLNKAKADALLKERLLRFFRREDGDRNSDSGSE